MARARTVLDVRLRTNHDAEEQDNESSNVLRHLAISHLGRRRSAAGPMPRIGRLAPWGILLLALYFAGGEAPKVPKAKLASSRGDGGGRGGGKAKGGRGGGSGGGGGGGGSGGGGVVGGGSSVGGGSRGGGGSHHHGAVQAEKRGPSSQKPRPAAAVQAPRAQRWPGCDGHEPLTLNQAKVALQMYAKGDLKSADSCRRANFANQVFAYRWSNGRCCRRTRDEPLPVPGRGRNTTGAPLICTQQRPARSRGDGRLVVYTVGTGGYDQSLQDGLKHEVNRTKAWREEMAREEIDFVYFCDAATCPSVRKMHPAGSSLWRVVELDAAAGIDGALLGGRAQAASRDVKLRPHRYPELARHAKSLYLDANVLVSHSPRALFDLVGNASHGIDFAAFDFPRTLAAEGDHVAYYLKTHLSLSPAAEKAAEALVKRQVKRYMPTIVGSRWESRIPYGACHTPRATLPA